MKVFDGIQPNERRYRCHIGNIHYPDTSKIFHDIDTTLMAQTGGVYQEKCFYHCEVPDTADGVFGFYNRDHYFSLRLVGVSSVGYTPIKDTWGDLGKGYRYTNAFGDGIHFEVIAKNMSFEKRICFEKPPANIKQDFTFDYEIVDAPSVYKFKDTNSGLTTAIDVTKGSGQAVKLESKITSIMSAAGKYESLIYFPMCYDSNGVRMPVKILFYTDGGKTYLRKIIPKEIFANAVYPIYADDPVRYDPPAGDGMIDSSNASWDTCHDATSGGWAGPSYEQIEIQTSHFGSYYYISRGFLPIDTSGITDGDTVTAAVLYAYGVEIANTDNDGDDWINVVGQTTQPSTSTLTTADIELCGAVDDPTEGATRIDLGSLSTSAYNQFTFNATGRGWVNKTGITMIGLREGHDCIDDSCQTSTSDKFTIYASEQSGTATDPYLDVTASAAVTLEQEGFRWRNDDDSEASATWIENQDVDASIAKETNIRLRILVNATDDPDSTQYELQYKRTDDGAGEYRAIPES